MPTARTTPLQALAHEVAATLVAGKAFRLPHFGTFTTCTRRATSERAATTMAMFTASTELRAYASGGPLPNFSGHHAAAMRLIAQGMLSEHGVTIPQLGRMAAVPVSGSKPKLIFHGATELNTVLATASDA